MFPQESFFFIPSEGREDGDLVTDSFHLNEALMMFDINLLIILPILDSFYDNKRRRGKSRWMSYLGLQMKSCGNVTLLITILCKWDVEISLASIRERMISNYAAKYWTALSI